MPNIEQRIQNSRSDWKTSDFDYANGMIRYSAVHLKGRQRTFYQRPAQGWQMYPFVGASGVSDKILKAQHNTRKELWHNLLK